MSQSGSAANLEETVDDRASLNNDSEVALNLSVVVYTLTGVKQGQPQYDSVPSSYNIKLGISNALKIGFGEEDGINLGKPTDEQRSWLAEGVELEETNGYGTLIFCKCDRESDELTLSYSPRRRTSVSLQRGGEVTLFKNITQVQTGDIISIAPTKFENAPLYSIQISEVHQA